MAYQQHGMAAAMAPAQWRQRHRKKRKHSKMAAAAAKGVCSRQLNEMAAKWLASAAKAYNQICNGVMAKNQRRHRPGSAAMAALAWQYRV